MTEDDRRFKELQVSIIMLLKAHKTKPELCFEVLQDLALSMACSARRTDISILDFKDSLMKAISNTLDHYLKDPDLQKMADEYNEYVRKSNRQAQHLRSGRVLEDPPEAV